MSLKKKNEKLDEARKIKFLEKLTIKYDFSIEAERNYPYINYMNIHKFMDVLGIAQSIINDIKSGSEPNSIYDFTFSNASPEYLLRYKYILSSVNRSDLYDIENDMYTLKSAFQMLCLNEFDPSSETVDMNNIVNIHTRMAEKLEGLCIALGIPEEDSLVGKSIMYLQAIPSNATKNQPIFY